MYYGNDRVMQKIDPELAERFRLACPEWAKHILNSDGKECPDMCFFADGKTWNILDGTSCMVGEAHGRRNDYVTGENDAIVRRMYDVLYRYRIRFRDRMAHSPGNGSSTIMRKITNRRCLLDVEYSKMASDARI